jgi:spore coat polysaccharide biosynthesis predicted glycosyltransferase SpsG/RimJ/RimL family protein N-acetyltransferase
MKVIILTEGGKNIGLGHISRCMSLYAEVSKREISTDFIINGDVSSVDFIHGITFKNENWLQGEFLHNYITADDYIIIDSYKAEKAVYDSIVKLSNKAMFIDDIGRLNYPEGFIVNPSLDSSSIDYSNSPNSILLSGPDYVIVRPPFVDIKRESVYKGLTRILITMGGTDIRELTPLLVNNVCKNLKDIEFDIVIGSREADKFCEQFSRFKNVVFHHNIDATEMFNLMINCDLAITAAGQTIYELLATQTPFIPIQIIKNQENNIRSLLKYNPNQIVLKHNDIDLVERILNALDIYDSSGDRKEQNKAYEGLIDGNGSKRIIDALFNEMGENEGVHLRRAQKRDIKDVFELSNEDYVRRYSINKNKILWDDHVKWFNNILEDNNVVFYVVTDWTDSFLGQIRFNLEKDTATVSISLSDKLRGRGLSKSLLKQSIDKLFVEENQVNEIIAHVSESNVASMKIFKGLNFKVNDTNDSMIKLMLRRKDYVN